MFEIKNQELVFVMDIMPGWGLPHEGGNMIFLVLNILMHKRIG